MNVRNFASGKFSKGSLLITEFKEQLEFVNHQNGEVIRQLLEFKLGLISQHEAILPKLRRQFYSQSYWGRISSIINFCSVTIMLLTILSKRIVELT